MAITKCKTCGRLSFVREQQPAGCAVCSAPISNATEIEFALPANPQESEEEYEALLASYLHSLTLSFFDRRYTEYDRSLLELGPMALEHLSRTDDLQELDKLMRQIASFLHVPDVLNACEVAQLCLRIMTHGGDPELCAREIVNRFHGVIQQFRAVVDDMAFDDITMLLPVRDRICKDGQVLPADECLPVLWEERGRPETIPPKLTDEQQVFLSVSLLAYPLMQMLTECSELCRELRDQHEFLCDLEWIVSLDSGLMRLKKILD